MRAGGRPVVISTSVVHELPADSINFIVVVRPWQWNLPTCYLAFGVQLTVQSLIVRYTGAPLSLKGEKFRGVFLNSPTKEGGVKYNK